MPEIFAWSRAELLAYLSTNGAMCEDSSIKKKTLVEAACQIYNSQVKKFPSLLRDQFNRLSSGRRAVDTRVFIVCVSCDVN